MNRKELFMDLYKPDAVSVDVGSRLRELREVHGMSMRALAVKSGLSANALSMIERNKTSPSISTLHKLADTLGVSITAFFGAQPEKQQAIFMKADARTHIPFTRGVFEGLGGEQFTGRVEPFVLTLETGASSGPHTMSHSGHEFVFCLRGEIEYVVERNVYSLTPGDSLLFAAHLRHRWRNPGRTVANTLIVLSGFAEGEELHAMHWKKGE
jgi:transcriptional regulator with XRE-family HTH domain